MVVVGLDAQVDLGLGRVGGRVTAELDLGAAEPKANIQLRRWGSSSVGHTFS